MGYSNSTLGMGVPRVVVNQAQMMEPDQYPQQPPDRKVGGVERALDYQREALQTLEQAVAELGERISPALLPSNPQAACGGENQVSVSPAALSIQECTARIRLATERVVNLLQRVDL